MSKLENAERHRRENAVDRAERPAFHFTAPVGWINDPNGFSMYGGRIHLFYQYHPFSDAWGPMYWGHAVSRDFLLWEDLPVALAPDAPQDAGGCFSGCAVEVPDGRQALVYTGTRKVPSDGGRATLQQQCLALGDGVRYDKHPGNPVIEASMLPEGFSGRDFRDPKIRVEGGQYRLVASAADADGLGHILEYASENLVDWRYSGDLASSDGTYGDMWECPDVFRLGDRDMLVVSTMHMPDVPGYHDAYGCVCFDKDPADPAWDVRAGRPVDWGRDFYAAQTMVARDGRRVLISWLQSWDNFIKPKDMRWHGMMSVPRELSWRDGAMRQAPVRELLSLRAAAARVRLDGPGSASPEDVRGRCLDIHLEAQGSLEMRLAEKDGRAVVLEWDPARSVLRLDRSAWAPETDRYAVQEMPVEGTDGHLDMRVVLDTCSVECFLNDGRQAMSATYYAPGDADGMTFSVPEGSRVDALCHVLRRPDAPNDEGGIS